MLPSVLLILTSSLVPADNVGQPPLRVGQILICGNVCTPQSIILNRFPLYPGQVLTNADLQAASRGLSRLHWLGIGSTVGVLEPDVQSEYRDILIAVNETAVTYLLFKLPDDFLAWLRKE